jgi:hypothetical protein
MVKKTHTYEYDARRDRAVIDPRTGRPKVVEETKLPRHLRDHTPYDVHTFTEGPIARLFNRTPKPKKGKK